MAAKDIRLEWDAIEGILKGAEALATPVRATFGPKGRNVIFQRSFGDPRITKDGVTVAKEIELEDPLQQMGAQIVRSAASKTNDLVGDGTTTATILTSKLLKGGAQLITSGYGPVQFRRALDEILELVSKKLLAMAQPVRTSEEIYQIATISSNGDTEIGKKLSEAFEKVGKEGVITVEESKSFETELEIVEGMQFDRGYVSPYFVTNVEKMRSELENPYILIYEKKLSNVQPLLPVLEAVARAQRPLFIIAEDIEGEALTLLVVNKMRGSLNVCASKAPGFGDRRKELMQDIACLVGTRVISEERGDRLEDIKLDDLGSGGNVIIEKEITKIVRGAGKPEAIKAHVANLVALNDNEKLSDYEREKLRERIARLSKGVAVIRVGGATEVELKEKKDRVEDAKNATRVALDEEGIVPGGGLALLRVSSVLEDILQKAIAAKNTDVQSSQDDGESRLLKSAMECDTMRAAIRVMIDVLREPMRQIAENAGEKGDVIVAKTLENKNTYYGYDAARGQFCNNLMESGIIDATKVVLTAIKNAVSAAGTLLTTSAAISEKPKKHEPVAAGGAPGMGGMGGMDY